MRARAWRRATSSTRRHGCRRRPRNGVLVDETTYRATREAIDYDEAEPVEAKGKSEPVPVWEAVGLARASESTSCTRHARELVGRERELGVFASAFERARHERTRSS